MMEYINKLIDSNLKLICESNNKRIFSHKFLDINGNELTQKFRGEEFSQEMQKRGLVRITNELCIVEELGCNIYKNGGWLQYLKRKHEIELKKETHLREKEILEYELANSNLRANKLNEKIEEKNDKNEKKNRVTTWINIGIGFLNLVILLWQILKS